MSLNIEKIMGTDIYGYIEINTIEESGEDVWHEMIDISLIAERNYDIFGKLFGVRATEEINILAKSRGIPLDTANRKSLMEYEEDIVYHSWANWSEIEEFLAKVTIREIPWGWSFIFSSMASLSEKWCGNNIRLVVMFDNSG